MFPYTDHTQRFYPTLGLWHSFSRSSKVHHDCCDGRHPHEYHECLNPNQFCKGIRDSKSITRIINQSHLLLLWVSYPGPTYTCPYGSEGQQVFEHDDE